MSVKHHQFFLLLICVVSLLLAGITGSTVPEVKKDADDYEYLVVTSNNLKEGFDPFIEFNTRRCLRTKVITVEDIWQNNTGIDGQDKIRNCIKKEYDNYRICYVMLAGDVNKVPDRKFHVEYYDGLPTPTDFMQINVSADMYYECLDNTWNPDGDNEYAWPPSLEDDFDWDVYTGRVPVDNRTELNNIINKTIKYSEQPVTNAIQNVLMGEYDTLTDDHFEEFVGTPGGFSNSWEIIKLPSEGLTSEKALEMINTGKPAWVDHMGHASSSSMLRLMSNQITDANFNNDGTTANFFILYSQGCNAGDFTVNDALCERLVVGISRGAVGFIGNSGRGVSALPSVSRPEQLLHKYFHHAVFREKLHYLGMMNAYTKELVKPELVTSDIRTPPYYGTMRTVVGINLLGDPALSVWTESPKQWTNTDFSFNGNTFAMDTKVPYTWVALCGEAGNIITTQLTGKDGLCSIDDEIVANYFADHPEEDLKVRIKAHNYLPFLSEAVRISRKNIVPNNHLRDLRVSGKSMLIQFSLDKSEQVTISLYNAKGMKVKTLFNRNMTSGRYSQHFRCNDINSGVYYICLKTDSGQDIVKAVIAD